MTTEKHNTTNYLVQQSNSLIETSQSFTLVERRLIYHILSKINPNEITPQFELRVADFIESFPDIDPKNAYTQIREAVEKLWTRSIQFKTDKGTTKVFHFLEMKEYKNSEGYLKIEFHRTVIPMIFDLKLGNYTTIFFDRLKNLDSTYSLRLYELAMMIYKQKGYNHKNINIIALEDLRFFLNCIDTYPNFKYFRQWILDPALKEVSEKTELIVAAEYLRTGRKIDRIKLNIKNKELGENLLEPEKPIPKKPALKRHPNPEKYKNEDTGEFYEKTFFLDRFEWACINYKRLYDYKNALKEVEQKLDEKLEKKQQEYLNIITYSITDVKENGLPFLNILGKNYDSRELLSTLEEIKDKYLHSK